MTACTAVQCQKTYEIGECHRKRAVSFVDFVWRRGVRDEAVTGVSNAAGRAGRDVGSVRRLLEPVQHEDVAECPKTDAPQEASLCCEMDNNSNSGCNNGCPPLRARSTRVIAERRQDED